MNIPERMVDGATRLTGSEAGRAREQATAAARRSGVLVLANHDHEDLEEAYRVVESVWRPAADDPPITRALLRALTHGGNYLTGAYDGQAMIGVCVGFFTTPLGDSMHSHLAGVLPEATGRHVGFAMKLDQRAWALERGVSRVEWTFDPLVRRNAFFNIAKLGALATEYLVDFYGYLPDSINAGQHSDRLLAVWDLLDPDVVRCCRGDGVAQGIPHGAVVALDERDGVPQRTGFAVDTTCPVLVRVPEDIEGLRARDAVLAREWRFAVREALTAGMNRGAVVSGFTRDGWYVLDGGSR